MSADMLTQQMRAVIKNWEGEIGTVDLVGGVATPSNDRVRRLLDDFVVVEPGTPPRRLRPSDGETYLRALPANLRGAYLGVELRE
jgi:hypothetical protein